MNINDIPSFSEYCLSKLKAKETKEKPVTGYENDDHKLICELAKEGLMAYAIGYKFGISAEHVGIICRKHGVELVNRSNQTNKRTKQIVALVKDGYTSQQIMNILDCDQNLINQARKRHGLSVSKSVITEQTIIKCKEARKLVSGGMQVNVACKQVGVSESSYLKYKEAG